MLTDARFDFRGGLNTRVSPDLLQANELVETTNCRLSDTFGGLVKRTGTRRMHALAIGGGNPVTGVFQWDEASGKQLVAISNGNLYHKTTDFGAFTEVVPAVGDEFSTTTPQTFATARQSTSGAPLRLYIADGKVFRWTGSALTRIDGTASVPNADLIRLYHLRLFARDTDFGQHVFWSKLGDPEDFATGQPTDGGSAMVDVLRGEALTAFEVIGSSLLLSTSDSIVRFTGYSNEDITIKQDTEGISGEVGAVGPQALLRVETFAAMLGDRGPYAVLESGVQPIGVQVEPEFDAIDRTAIGNAVIGYHSGRREVWFAVQGSGDTGNRTVYVFNLGLQAWSGPFTYPFAIHSLASWEDSNGDEFLIAGCGDGFVRLMDTGNQDDVLSDNTGGSTYTMTVELPPVFFGTPARVKTLRRLFLQADVVNGDTVTLKHAFDGAALATGTITGQGTPARSYRLDRHAQGRRLRLQIEHTTANALTVHGLITEAFDQARP